MVTTHCIEHDDTVSLNGTQMTQMNMMNADNEKSYLIIIISVISVLFWVPIMNYA